MAKFNLQKEIEAVEERVINQNYLLGKGLMQPNRATNSGSRAIMQCTQSEQIIGLVEPEPPLVCTGYENRYGENSSNYELAEANYTVLDRISKYDFDNGKYKKYVLILLDSEHDTLDYIERTKYEYVSESYGYHMNTDFVDNLNVGDFIPEGSVMKKTNSFDKYNNHQSGRNLRTMYIANGLTTEDPTVISQSAANKFISPLFDEINVMINDNDILLNLYGGDEVNEYKAFPNIGEEVKDGMLCAIRRKNKKEALFTQSWNRLKETMISDEKYPIDGGTVIDIDVQCNNVEDLRNSIYNQQLLIYYDATKEYCRKIIDTVKPLRDKGLKCTNKLQELYDYCMKVVNEKQYLNEKIFNNITMKVTIVRMLPLNEGDKITDRYGGKGVISRILPDDQMPQIEVSPGVFEPVDILYNKCTCVNRLNPGQLFETSITAYGDALVSFIATYYKDDIQSAAELIYQYLNILVPNEAKYFWETYINLAEDDKYIFIRSYICDGSIYVVSKPMTESISLDTLRQLKEAFPYLTIQRPVVIKMKDSAGNIRPVRTHNSNITIGKKYIYRLKQIAEEKFSAVSLAATNIRGENVKSNASKLHKALFSTTPVRFGEMEFGDFMHMLDAILVDSQLMRSSSSPIGRMQHKDLLTGDPFVADIKLNSEAKSRPVEIVNAYLRTIGLQLVISKKEKNKLIVKRNIVTRLAPICNTDILQRLPYDISPIQAQAIVYHFNKAIGKPFDIAIRESIEDQMKRDYEAARIANLGMEQDIKDVDSLIKAIDNKEVVNPRKNIAWRDIAERFE